MVGGLGGHSEVSEGNDIVLEVLGVSQSLGNGSVVSESWRMVGIKAKHRKYSDFDSKFSLCAVTT